MPLYLEWAPVDVFTTPGSLEDATQKGGKGEDTSKDVGNTETKSKVSEQYSAAWLTNRQGFSLEKSLAPKTMGVFHWT